MDEHMYILHLHAWIYRRTGGGGRASAHGHAWKKLIGRHMAIAFIQTI